VCWDARLPLFVSAEPGQAGFVFAFANPPPPWLADDRHAGPVSHFFAPPHLPGEGKQAGSRLGVCIARSRMKVGVWHESCFAPHNGQPFTPLVYLRSVSARVVDTVEGLDGKGVSTVSTRCSRLSRERRVGKGLVRRSRSFSQLSSRPLAPGSSQACQPDAVLASNSITKEDPGQLVSMRA